MTPLLFAASNDHSLTVVAQKAYRAAAVTERVRNYF